MNISSALDFYLLQLAADGRSPHTVGQYRRHIRSFATWLAQAGHSGDVGAIGHEDVARFLSTPGARTTPRGAAKRATSMNALRTSVRTFFGFLHAAGTIAANPARLLRRARCGTAPPRAMGDDDRDRLLARLAAAVGPAARRDEMLVRLLLGAGLRIGSAVALDVGDVDLAGGELRLRTTKGDVPETVYLSADLVTRLGSYVGDRTTGPLFATLTGARVTTRHSGRRFAEAVVAAGLTRHFSPHSCRHTFATGLLKRSGDLALVQAALRHRSIASTLVYARVEPGRVRAAMEG